MSSTEDPQARWEHKIKLLNEAVWERRINRPQIAAWLRNFSGSIEDSQKEQLRALHLLQHFMYFGLSEIRELVRSLYRDQFMYPTVQLLRDLHPEADESQIATRYTQYLLHTRFVPVGNPSESGAHILYYFRQENTLPKDLFSSTDRLFLYQDDTRVIARDQTLRCVTFVDDVCGSGAQALEYLERPIRQIRKLIPGVLVRYLILFGTAVGVQRLRDSGMFDDVAAAILLSDDYKAFSPNSLCFTDAAQDGIDRDGSRRVMHHYGSTIAPPHPLGYLDAELLLGFYHNVPDNTLPVFWSAGDGTRWIPIFPRHPKINLILAR